MFKSSNPELQPRPHRPRLSKSEAEAGFESKWKQNKYCSSYLSVDIRPCMHTCTVAHAFMSYLLAMKRKSFLEMVKKISVPDLHTRTHHHTVEDVRWIDIKRNYISFLWNSPCWNLNWLDELDATCSTCISTGKNQFFELLGMKINRLQASPRFFLKKSMFINERWWWADDDFDEYLDRRMK